MTNNSAQNDGNSNQGPSNQSKESRQPTGANRRAFIKASSAIVAGGAAAASVSIARGAHAFGSDTIKIGLIGCGGRGTGATKNAMNTTGGDVRIIAMADAFPHRMQQSIRAIKDKFADKFDVPKEQQFIGLEAYKQVLETDVDMVLLATPPGFRPLHFEAAINAGKHVFMEKPVAVDAPGVRRVLKAGKLAKEKNLAVAVGLQRRHEVAYNETMAKIHDGAIGEILLGRAYWNGGGVWTRPRKEGQTELEYQVNNWYYFNWLSGDHIDEQHIHNLDVMNWLFDGYPVEANGMGGRQVRTSNLHGEIYDHHFIEFTYGKTELGIEPKMYSQCRHIQKCWRSVSEHCHGTLGTADISGGKLYGPNGDMIWSTSGKRNGHQEEHHDLFAALRRGDIPNEAEYGAKSTMTAIFGRMATYSGKLIRWDDAINSDLKLADVDKMTSYDVEAPVQPDADGNYKVPMPGEAIVM